MPGPWRRNLKTDNVTDLTLDFTPDASGVFIRKHTNEAIGFRALWYESGFLQGNGQKSSPVGIMTNINENNPGNVIF
jgi:hypothetical protein